MRRSARPALQAILQSIQRIDEAMTGKSLGSYATDWQLKYAVERAIEIISEASRRLPAHLRDRHPEVEWKQVLGIGNVLRHDYDEIVDEIVFAAVRKRLPDLKAAIIAIEASLDEPEE
jgi:uncharacterized protein with HEPN domain